MKKIGITGGIASGKSTVCGYIIDAGYDVISCDELSHQIFASPECQDLLFNCFAKHLGVRLDKKDPLTRDVVRKAFLISPSFRKEYEEWIHPKIREKMMASPVQIVEVPLLFEKNMEGLFEEIWVVYCNKDSQIKRIKKRGRTSEEAHGMMSLQISPAIKLNKATRSFCTDDMEGYVKAKVTKALSEVKWN